MFRCCWAGLGIRLIGGRRWGRSYWGWEGGEEEGAMGKRERVGDTIGVLEENMFSLECYVHIKSKTGYMFDWNKCLYMVIVSIHRSLAFQAYYNQCQT